MGITPRPDNYQLNNERPKKSNAIWYIIGGIGCAFFMIIPILAAILFPVFARARESARKVSCQSNLKELALAVNMYCGDWDNTLPSSVIISNSKTWNEADFVQFGSGDSQNISWANVLSSYTKNPGIVRCPSDKQSAGTSSYFWKAAFDRAWFGGFKKEASYNFPADQVVMYESAGWHWGDAANGLSDNVTLNMAFLDGHVAARRIQNSGFAPGEAPSPLPKSGKGEPAWFNFDNKTNSTSVGQFWNPKVYYDSLY